MADKCPALKITLKGDPKEVFVKIKKKADKEGFTLNGDHTKGKLSYKNLAGKIYGNYTVKGKDVNLQMFDDMGFVDCKKINSKIKEFFDGM